MTDHHDGRDDEDDGDGDDDDDDEEEEDDDDDDLRFPSRATSPEPLPSRTMPGRRAHFGGERRQVVMMSRLGDRQPAWPHMTSWRPAEWRKGPDVVKICVPNTGKIWICRSWRRDHVMRVDEPRLRHYQFWTIFLDHDTGYPVRCLDGII